MHQSTEILKPQGRQMPRHLVGVPQDGTLLAYLNHANVAAVRIGDEPRLYIDGEQIPLGPEHQHPTQLIINLAGSSKRRQARMIRELAALGRIVEFNDHRIAIPRTVKLEKASHTLPGDFDMLTYRGFAIIGYDHAADGVADGTLVDGPLFVDLGGGSGDLEMCASLADAMAEIDHALDKRRR